MKRRYQSAIPRWVCGAFFSYLLVASQPPGGVVWAQTSRGQPIDYKLVPNLQPMNDNSPTPDFTLPTPAGRRVALKDFRGKVVFLNFWASWCDPCREEMPAMERLYQEFKDRGLVVLAINVKDSQKKAVDFAKELKLTYPVAFDTEGQAGLLYGAWGLPTTYLIGRGGEGLARIWGPADWYSAGARELMRALLEGRR
jgi:peroxiredoxin